MSDIQAGDRQSKSHLPRAERDPHRTRTVDGMRARGMLSGRELISGLAQVEFPAIPNAYASSLLSMAGALDDSQWWSLERIRAAQHRQLGLLLRHAATIPWYAARLREAGVDPAEPVTEASWRRIPILRRAELRAFGLEMRSAILPAGHGRTETSISGGSTGVPVEVVRSNLNNAVWEAIELRNQLWHVHDPLGGMAVIRYFGRRLKPEGLARTRSAGGLAVPNWGRPASALWRTGPAFLMDFTLPAAAHFEFLRRHRPQYLVTFPSVARLLIAYCRETGQRITSLRAVMTVAEQVDDVLRQGCREVLGSELVDAYSSSEIGYIGLQCPEHGHLHEQSENCMVELVNDNDQPVQVGQVGRVVVTGLHSFAQPLLRYELGDLAERGPSCRCGRGLPVLARVVGRSDDIVHLPGGGRRTGLMYTVARLGKISTAIREGRVIQHTRESIELQVVASRPLTDAEREEALAHLRREFPEGFDLTVSQVDKIPRTEAGKLRVFVSRVNSD